MGTVLSSPKSGGYWNQLRPSKSTFSLKDKTAGTSGATGFFRHSLTGSASIRKLGQSGFSRRKERPAPQEPTIATISAGSCWSGDVARVRTPELRPSDRRNNNSNSNNNNSNSSNNNNNSGGGRPAKLALSKSTSCYAFRHRPADGKENDEAAADKRRLVIQANTGELLKCLAAFLHCRCPRAACEPAASIGWIRSIDRSLILQGWADLAFVNPPNLVFLFMLVKTAAGEKIASERQLQQTLFACMYVAYSYMGNEISYPLKPFLGEQDRDAFWDRCLGIVGDSSADMLRINSDPAFFIELFTELKSYA